MRSAAIATAAFLLGGTTAAGLSTGHEPAAKPNAPPRQAAAAPAGRILVNGAASQRALAGGLLLHPVTTILAVPGKMQFGDYRWSDKGVGPGRTWVRVDLKSQIISVFRGGQEIGTAVILYGADGLQTPAGKYPVLAKLKDHRSQIYDAPMPYTLRLTSDGISIHASNVRWGFATHGCVGVPMAFAARLFEATSVGDEVLIVGDRTTRPGTA